MDEMKIDEKKLAEVTGGGPQGVVMFGDLFRWDNCRTCTKWDNGCTKSTEELYKAFNGDVNAKCPDHS